MKTTYETKIAARCPEDGALDLYHATFESDEKSLAENILAAIETVTIETHHQEDITAELADLTNCRVCSLMEYPPPLKLE